MSIKLKRMLTFFLSTGKTIVWVDLLSVHVANRLLCAPWTHTVDWTQTHDTWLLECYLTTSTVPWFGNPLVTQIWGGDPPSWGDHKNMQSVEQTSPPGMSSVCIQIVLCLLNYHCMVMSSCTLSWWLTDALWCMRVLAISACPSWAAIMRAVLPSCCVCMNRTAANNSKHCTACSE